jgi:3-oxoacyl-[acyl-carrier-protein] synthase-3
MHASIAAIEYYLPESTLTTEDLSSMFPEWGVGKIAEKTGIQTRHIAAENELASDLAIAAVHRLFESGVCSPEQVDYLLLCTQSSDHAIPTTACILQHRLGIPTSAGALDFNLGCSGYIYGLGLAEGLIVSGQATTMLLVTADTYSKYIRKDDKNCRTIFGDGATATLIVAREGDSAFIGPFIYGTDGTGATSLMLLTKDARMESTRLGGSNRDRLRGDRERFLYMDGSQIFNFTMSVVPDTVSALLKKASMEQRDVELFVFHQANAYILRELRRVLGITENKFQVTLRDSANTTSSTIPIALKHAKREGRLQNGTRVMLVGFGVGYSWGATIVRWTEL